MGNYLYTRKISRPIAFEVEVGGVDVWLTDRERDDLSFQDICRFHSDHFT